MPPHPSTIAEQVPNALADLTRAFSEAHLSSGGVLLDGVLRERPDDVYRGLAAVLLRCVFLIYAEDRGIRLLGTSADRSVRELFAELETGDPAPADGRGWARLVEMFRLVHRGDPGSGILARGGRLFDPDAYPFLEGPPIPDQVVRRVLSSLLTCAGQPVSYATLDVEHLGSIHEAMLGFRIQVADRAAVIVRPRETVVDVGALLALAPGDRAAMLARDAGVALNEREAAAVGGATDADGLAAALVRRLSPRHPAILRPGAVHLQPTEDRRRSGSHYTPRALAERVVGATLAPLLASDSSRDEPAEPVLSLAVCDPAMGCGAFVLEACRVLGDALLARWARDGERDETLARRRVAERCLCGVDRDPMAVELAKLSLWLLTRAEDAPFTFVDHALREGDSLVGTLDAGRVSCPRGFDWDLEFPDVAARGGFDAFIGNPPWVAYAGRAAEPISDALFEHYRRTSPAFFGYRTLHGIFIHRAASLLRAGGRLGLVVPTSVSDLAGYEPTRRAHDELCVADPDLPDFGSDAFEGVFQPAMALLSTRRAGPPPPALGADRRTPSRWSIARPDFSACDRRLLERLSAIPPLPPALFGERGYQTSGGEAALLRETVGASGDGTPIREGADIAAFVRRQPRLHFDPGALRGRLRSVAEWREVRVLIRQTARFPIAALSDGIAFRNSILAGFEGGGWSGEALVAYLNSSVARWFHFTKHRDARQGMPQVKIAHLRSLPAPPGRAELAAFGERVGRANRGITDGEQRELDGIVAALFDLTEPERAIVETWRAANPEPAQRSAGRPREGREGPRADAEASTAVLVRRDNLR